MKRLQKFALSWAAIALLSVAGNLGAELPAPGKEPTPRILEEMVALKASDKSWIEIDLSSQRLIAWEGNKPVYAVIISTGKKATPTPVGIFAIESKRPRDRMRGEDYDISDVPHAMYFYKGYAIHGAYWHNRFGTPVSHGCINVAVDHAKWLFNWATLGTPVIIHD